MTHLERLFAALWISEVWNAAWHENHRIHHKARAVVVFDRVLNMTEGVEHEAIQA